MKTATSVSLRYLEDRWDENIAGALDQPELLRYRSNLLGSDLRITNFGGGNTSSKIVERDPLDGSEQQVLWVKGSGGDLGSIKRSGFATLYMNKLLALANSYRGVQFEDEMVDLYPLCTFGKNNVAASIDTPLHGFLPFAHVDHLHPDWGIALAAAANGHEKMAEFNQSFQHNLIWLPWQRPGFELGMMLRKAIEENPTCDGVVLGGHGLFTWGDTQRECYLNTITIIDQLGQFVIEHVEKKGSAIFGGTHVETRADHRELVIDIFPFLRGRVSAQRRLIGTFTDLPEVQRFVNSKDAEKLAFLGTSCPDHFIRTKIRPLYVPWNPKEDLTSLHKHIDAALANYREEYAKYYGAHAKARVASDARRQPDSRSDSRHWHVQLWQEQDGVAHHGRVLCERHPRDGGRVVARIGQATESIAAVGPSGRHSVVPGALQLRCAASIGGLPHRILGAGGSQDTASAFREGVEPSHRAGRRRR